MSYAAPAVTQRSFSQPVFAIARFPLTLIHLLAKLPTFLFLATLTAMLFRPPDLKTFPWDRIAFGVLMTAIGFRISITRERVNTFAPTWPLLGLLLLGLWGAVTQPYDPQAWSLLMAKWGVPFACLHAAGMVFREERSRAKLEAFLLMVLLYLSVISVLSLLNATDLIFPRYIADESIGIHAERARGPLLQAVANGVCLNLLGLCALDAYRRGRLRGMAGCALVVMVPLALLATKTRAVWASAAVSLVCVIFFAPSRKQRRVARGLFIVAGLSVAALVFYRAENDTFSDRLVDRSPVDFRTEMYQAGWGMFTEKPLLGWGNEWQVQPEIEKRVSGFHPDYYVFHNTFLELAVERGLLGLGLYFWLLFSLFKLGQCRRPSKAADALASGRHFGRLWPVLLFVYVFNASAVVMNYQFVNALLFTLAGILASQNAGSRNAQAAQSKLADA